MRRNFPTSIYVGPSRRVARPKYHQTTLLDLVRQERQLATAEKAMNQMIADACTHGLGVGMMRHVEPQKLFRRPQDGEKEAENHEWHDGRVEPWD